MPHSRAPYLRLLPLLALAACSPGGPASSPSAPTSVNVPTPGTPPIVAGPSDRGRVPPESARSVADAVTPGRLFARDQDQIDVVSVPSAGIAIRYRARFVPGYTGLIEFVLTNTGSGWQEKFLVQVPPTPPTTPVPMLVVFHKFGSSHGDVLNTTFLDETQTRGWFCVAPLGARQKHFGSREMQVNTRAALELVAQLFPVDRDRVYGVGFSMGGGALANYAERHLDPAGIRFAAICNHTGGISLSHTWFNEPDDADLDDDFPTAGLNLEVPDILEDLYGGAPSQVPFEYQRSSSIDLDPISGQIGIGTDMGRNLAAIPTSTWIANADPLAYLVQQTYAFTGYLQAQTAVHQFTVAPGTTHTWATIDETAICDWLQTKTLQTPRSGNTIADEDGNWYHFGVEQSVPGQFTPFTWSLELQPRIVSIRQTANLERMTVDAPGAGLALSGVVTLRVGNTTDGTGDRVRFLGVASSPIAVTRDGAAASGTYDAFNHTFEVHELDSGPHEWLLTFP
jgi:pimeloyl-ACP methyl ester carboxylesterase